MTTLSKIKDGFGFCKANYKYIFFTCLFFSLLIAQLYFNSLDTSLDSFFGRSMGEASVNGVDVGKRVFAFYSSGFMFILGNIVFYALFYLLFKKKNYNLKWLRLPNVLSMVGCVSVFGSAMDYALPITSFIILALVICSVVFVIVKKKYIPELNRKLFNESLYALIACFSLFLFFLFAGLFPLKTSFVFFLPLGFIILLAAVVVLFKRGQCYLARDLEKWAYIFFPFSVIPLARVLDREIYMILNGHGILFSRYSIFVVLVILLGGWVFYRYHRSKQKTKYVLITEMLYKRYFPLLVIGVSAFCYYEPFYETKSAELFENANRFLPVMEFYKYNLVPLVQKFNSHLLSDFITVFLYSLFNKMDGMSPLIYDFIFPTFSAFITYLVLRDVTRNHFIALFVVLLFPFMGELIPVSFSVALIGIYILKKFIAGPLNMRSYLWLFAGVTFLIVWRIDIGLGALVGFALVFFLYSVFGKLNFSFKTILKSVSVFALIFLLIGLALYLRGINVISTAKDFLSHISASQSYGFSNLNGGAEFIDVLLFNLHHYVFPIAVLAITLYLIFNFRILSEQKRTRFALLSVLFCIGFYIGNFQRGLVRHGFVEHTDVFLSSFVFLIFGIFVYLFFQKRSPFLRFTVFTVCIFVFITSFKYDELKPQALTDLLASKEVDELDLDPNTCREMGADILKERYEPFRKFVVEELKNDETFIDFSNTPMFYYFTGKETPSYFFQNPICMHNDHLQDRFLEELKNYKVPVVLFSRSHQIDDQWGWDYMDFVPNTLRHYKIAEYLFNNYEPFTIVKDHCVWRKKGKQFSKADSLYEKDHYSTKAQAWNIGMIPYLWANYDEKIKKVNVENIVMQSKELIADRLEFDMPSTIDRSKGNYVYLELNTNNSKNETVKLVYGPGSGEIDFTIPPGKGLRSFAIRVSAQYNWYDTSNTKIGLIYSGYIKIYLEKMSIFNGN